MKLVSICLLLTLSSVAMAQETLVEVSEESNWHAVWSYLQPVAATLATVLGPVVLAALTSYLVQLFRKAGIEISDAHRKMLHDAAENALNQAIAKHVGTTPNMITGKVPVSVMRDAIEYMRTLNPQTTKALGDPALADIIMSKAPKVQAVISAGTGHSDTTGTVEVANVDKGA